MLDFFSLGKKSEKSSTQQIKIIADVHSSKAPTGSDFSVFFFGSHEILSYHLHLPFVVIFSDFFFGPMKSLPSGNLTKSY